MQEIEVRATRGPYKIVVGESLYGKELVQMLEKLGPYNQLVLVSHPRILELYGSDMLESLNCHLDPGVKPVVFTFPEGEQNKNISTLEQGYRYFLDNGVGRKAILLAFGGGVVGDLGGYLAASYLRGIRYIQLPTTLMAMVDSGIGGKVGVDLPGAKNAVGAFYQPEAVISSIDVLKSLDLREVKSGMAEVAKYGFLYDERLLDGDWQLESLADIKNLEWLISRCADLKSMIVAIDELDINGERAILNYGHTFGHALESSTSYNLFRHGEAIAIGMMMAAKVAELAHIAALGLYQSHSRVLRPLLGGLSISDEVDTEEIMKDMERDKKREAGLRFVLLKEINQPCLVDSPSKEVVRSAIQEVIDDLKGD